MPGIIFNPFRKKDLEEPSLSMLNEFWRKLAEQINELWGLTGPVLLHDDLDLQGHSILNATLAGAAASSSSTAPSLYGPHSNRPNAAGTAEGTLYLETDRTVLYQLQLVSSVKRWIYIAGIMQGLFSGRPLASSLGPGDTGLLYHAGNNGQVYKFTYPAWSTMNLRGPLIEGTNAERLAGGRCDAKNLSVGTEFFETDTLLKYMVQTVAGVNTWIAEPAADIDVQKAGALIGTRRIVNFTEDGNVTLTMADNPGATRVDIGVKALPGGAVAPFTKLWGWDWTTLNDFLLFKSSGADTLAACADVYTTDVNTENCIPYLDFYNPAGSAAVTHLMMLSNVTLSPASGHLLFIDLDVKTLTATATTYGIVIAQGGSETDTFYQILLNHGGASAAMNKYTAAAYQHQFNAIGIAAQYQWKNAKILVNTSGAVIGGIPAGGLMLCNNGLLMWKKPMTLINATVLSGAVRVGLVLPGALGLKTNWLQMGRIEAYSVPPDFIQLLP